MTFEEAERERLRAIQRLMDKIKRELEREESPQ